MIRVKMTKNVMNQSVSALGLNRRQMVWLCIAMAVGVASAVCGIFYLSLPIDLVMWIVFAELIAVILVGVVRVGGMSLVQYVRASFKIEQVYFNKGGQEK